MKDSDGDGRTNGEELGDPDCTWVPGTAPKFTSGLSHPGVCEPMDSSVCEGKTGFVDCDAGEFMCPAVDEPGKRTKGSVCTSAQLISHRYVLYG